MVTEVLDWFSGGCQDIELHIGLNRRLGMSIARPLLVFYNIRRTMFLLLLNPHSDTSIKQKTVNSLHPARNLLSFN